MREEFENNGFITLPFPDHLREALLAYIREYVSSLGEKSESSMEEAANSLPDPLWEKKMSRCFRIFPAQYANEALQWAHTSLCSPFGKVHSAVNVVLPQEAQDNGDISENHLAIYWRCVRPGKADAGRPHRDANFWDLEFEEGYNPKIPFSFHYLHNCMKIWIPLYGCTQETALRVIPQSHRMEIPTMTEQTPFGRRPTICSKWIEEHKHLFTTPPALSQGSCIVFDMNLVHMGPSHNQNQLRISAEFNFITQ